MSEGFRKFKRKILCEALIKGLLLTLTSGALLSSAPILLQKFGIIDAGELFLLWFLLIGFGFGVLVGGIAFLIMRPTDKRVAYRVDRDLNFSDRAKTMVEFRKAEGSMFELQRTDADKKLMEAPSRAVRMKRLVIYIVAAALTVALLVVSLVLPAKAEEIDESTDDVGETVDDSELLWRIEQLRILIDEVKNEFLMSEEIRDDIVAELESLLAVVESTNLDEELDRAALETVWRIEDIVLGVNTAVPLGESLETSFNKQVATLGSALKKISLSDTKNALNAIKKLAAEDTEVAANLKEELDAYIEKSAIADDALKTIFSALSAKISEFSKSGIEDDLDAAFKSAVEQLEPVLYEQGDNGRCYDDIVARIEFIFGIDVSSATEDDGTDGSDGSQDADDGDGETEDDQEANNAGGYGPGGTQYASDDIVFDPDKVDHVVYGEIIDKYYGKYTEKRVDGLIDAELAEMLDKYFDSLYEVEEENENKENEDIENG